MLTEKDYRQLEWEISRIYSKIESDLVAKVCRAIARNEGVIDPDDWRLRKLSGYGVLEADIKKLIAYDTQSSAEALQEAIDDAYNANNRADEKLIRAIEKHAQKPFLVEYASDVQMARAAAILKNAKDAINLTNTTALQASMRSFTSAVNQAYVAVYEGTDTLSNAVYKATRSLARKGIMVEATYQPRGFDTKVTTQVATYTNERATISLDAAVRRNVVTSVAQATAEQSIAVAQDSGLDLVRTTAHAGARPEHFLWQGHIFSLSGKSDKYPSLVEGTGYGTVTGLCGCNCKHHFFPYVDGFTPADYGIHITEERNEELYEATQKQRGYERGVRSWKRVEDNAKAQGNLEDVAKARTMVREYQAKLRTLCDEWDLPRQYQREKV